MRAPKPPPSADPAATHGTTVGAHLSRASAGVRRAVRAGLGGRSAFADRWSRGGVALVALCLALYLPGLWSIPPVDRDESRFAQASAQMLASGTIEGWVVPRIQEKPRLNKPPMIYWLQSCSAWLCGVEEEFHHGGTESTEVEGEKNRLIDEELNREKSRAGVEARGGQDAAHVFALGGGSAPPEAQAPTPVFAPASIGPLPTAGIWAYRLPSVVCAILSALLAWRLGRRMMDARAAWLGAALMAACVMQLWDARQARADQLLLTTTTATMFALWNIWYARHRADTGGAARAAVFWVCLALGVMSKGPITPLVAGLTVLALGVTTGEWAWMKRLRPLMGIAIVLAVVVPWVGLVMREVGAAKYLSLIYDETLGRSVSAKEGHWGPPGYHTVLLAVMFWPGSLLTLAAVMHAVKRSRQGLTTEAQRAQRGKEEKRNVLERVRSIVRLNSSRVETFLLCWIAPAWVVFEVVGTKLPHYTLPMYPAIALLTARAAFAAETGKLAGVQGKRLYPGFIIWLFIGGAIALLAAGLVAAGRPSGDPRSGTREAVVAALVILLTVMLAGLPLQRRQFMRLHGVAIAAAIAVSIVVFGVALPRARAMWVTAETMLVVNEADPSGELPIVAVGYGEDSLIFHTRGRVKRQTTADAIDFFRTNRGVLILDTRGAPDWPDLVRPMQSVRAVEGFNYAKGQAVGLSIWRSP